MHVEPSVPEAGDDGSSEGMSQLRRRRVDLPQRSPVPPRSFPPRRAPGGTAVDITLVTRIEPSNDIIAGMDNGIESIYSTSSNIFIAVKIYIINIKEEAQITHVPHCPAAALPCRTPEQRLRELPPLPVALHRPAPLSTGLRCGCWSGSHGGTLHLRSGIRSEDKIKLN